MLPSEVAEVYRVCTKTVNNWAAEGIGPRFIQVTSRVRRYRKADVLADLNGE
ncbi:helix-turn-helix domain-containing protein [Brevibacterium casei]